MKRIRYLSLMLVLLCGTALWAQDDFNPTSPDEPGGPLVSKSKLTKRSFLNLMFNISLKIDL